MQKLIEGVLTISLVANVLFYVIPAFFISDMTVDDKLYFWKFTEAYIINTLVLCGYLSVYLLLRSQHKDFLSMYRFTNEEKASVHKANREIGKFFLFICQRLLIEIAGGVIFTRMLNDMTNTGMRRAYFYFSVCELLSETLLMAGICQSITRTVKTVREHASHELADTHRQSVQSFKEVDGMDDCQSTVDGNEEAMHMDGYGERKESGHSSSD